VQIVMSSGWHAVRLDPILRSDDPLFGGLGGYPETTMNAADTMVARGAHYTALLETIDRQGPAKLHAEERRQLLEAADALLFAEPENRRLLRSAEELIESLETSGRWTAETCDQLREHLYGCDAEVA
jgi:hypothetical protein